MNSDVGTPVTTAATGRRGRGRFALFAAVAFGPVALAYALGFWAEVDSLRYEQLSAGDFIGPAGLLALLLVALVGTYALWKRAFDQLVRGFVLFLAHEVLLLALGLFLATVLSRSAPRPDWLGLPFVPVLGMAATMLFYAQAIIFPSVVLATLTMGAKIPAAEHGEHRGLGAGAILVAILLALLPVAAVVRVHIRWVGPLGTDRPRQEALVDAAEDIAQALERYAAAHSGLYPPAGISWEPGDSTRMAYWFQLHETFGRCSTEVAVGHLPDNPFSGRRYQVGVDFFYFADSLEKPGDNQRTSTEKGSVPFAGMKAPRGQPGTIVILGYIPPGAAEPRPTEYALVPYLRDVSEPWHDSQHYKTYIVGHGPRAATEDRGR